MQLSTSQPSTHLETRAHRNLQQSRRRKYVDLLTASKDNRVDVASCRKVAQRQRQEEEGGGLRIACERSWEGRCEENERENENETDTLQKRALSTRPFAGPRLEEINEEITRPQFDNVVTSMLARSCSI